MSDDLEERELGERIRRAGRRPEIPPEDLRQIRAAARAAWRRRTGISRGRRYGALLALAASLVLVVLAGRSWIAERGTPAPLRTIGTIEVATGSTGGAGVGDVVTEGMRLATGTDGRLSIRSTAGRSVRLDRGTSAVLRSDIEIELLEGAVYVDSGRSSSSEGGLAIRTVAGIFHEIGTQYEVRVLPVDGSVRLRVREGLVRAERDGASHEAGRGEQLAIARDGSIERAAIDPTDPEWDWVVGAAPALEIEGRTLSDYLGWVARETGLRVVYADAALEREAAEIVLHGSIDGLRPDESLEAIVPGSGLAFRVDAGTLAIQKR